MPIISATYDANGSIIVMADQPDDEEGNPQPNITMSVPDDMANRDRRKLQAWVEFSEGVIAPYVEPAKTPDQLRTETFEALPERIDFVTRLKTATPAQIDTWLANNVTNLTQARTVLGQLMKLLATRIN